MKVSEVMTRGVHTVREDDLVRMVIDIICCEKFSGVPVVDSEERLVGIISEKDILRAMYPSQTEFYEDPLRSRDFEETEERYKNLVKVKTRELMVRNVITTSPDEPLLKAASKMLVKKIRRMPVIEDGKLVGVLSQGDIHQAIFERHIQGTNYSLYVKEKRAEC